MNNLFTDAGYISLNKHGEELCGDRVEIVSTEDSTIMVLADGLGSGVKANILSTLTSKILSTMIAGGMGIEECVDTVAKTLPICSVRQIAYSTFSIIRINDNMSAEMFQFDNPEVIVLRNGENYAYPISSRTVAGKTILESQFTVQEGDVFIAMSDGAPFAGVGVELNYGWQRENIIAFAEANYLPSDPAKGIASCIAEECNRLYAQRPGDDTTVAALKIRKRHPVNLVIGPPSSPDLDKRMMNLFFAKEGEKIVCGGTTSKIAADYLGRALHPTLDYPDPDIPPICELQGIDLVTEGVVTLSRVLQYAQEYVQGADLVPRWQSGKDGASLIAQKLFKDATDINFYVGRAVNPAHQNPDLPITFSIKIQLIEALAKCLEQMGKHIRVSYF